MRRGRTTASSWKTGCGTWWPAARPPAPWSRRCRGSPAPRRGSATGPGMRARRTRNNATGLTVLHPRYPVLPRVGMSLAPWLLYRALLPVVRRDACAGRVRRDRRALSLSRRRRGGLARPAARAAGGGHRARHRRDADPALRRAAPADPRRDPRRRRADCRQCRAEGRAGRAWRAARQGDRAAQRGGHGAVPAAGGSGRRRGGRSG